MSWIAVSVGLSLTTATVGVMQNRANIKANNRQVDIDNRANTHAIEEAMKEEHRLEDLEIAQNERIALRDSSSAVAMSANTGVAGVSAERNVDNVLFQSLLDENVIKANSSAKLFQIGNQGFSSSQNILSKKQKKPSVLGDALKIASAGVGTFSAMGGFKKGGKD